MKKRPGSTLVEVVTGAGVMMLIMLGTLSLFVTGLTYMTRTSTDLTLSGKNAQALRWISEYARTAMSVTITNGGKQVNYSLPAVNATPNAFTGGKEPIYPLVSDGVTRGFAVDFVAGTLTDLHNNKVIAKNISATDPDPGSSTFNQAYVPFTLAQVGSHRAIVIQLICSQKVNGNLRYSRMKQTVLLRNI